MGLVAEIFQQKISELIEKFQPQAGKGIKFGNQSMFKLCLLRR